MGRGRGVRCRGMWGDGGCQGPWYEWEGANDRASPNAQARVPTTGESRLPTLRTYVLPTTGESPCP
eukprot:3355326-Prymnesium_polylepis.1